MHLLVKVKIFDSLRLLADLLRKIDCTYNYNWYSKDQNDDENGDHICFILYSLISFINYKSFVTVIN